MFYIQYIINGMKTVPTRRNLLQFNYITIIYNTLVHISMLHSNTFKYKTAQVWEFVRYKYKNIILMDN